MLRASRHAGLAVLIARTLAARGFQQSRDSDFPSPPERQGSREEGANFVPEWEWIPGPVNDCVLEPEDAGDGWWTAAFDCESFPDIELCFGDAVTEVTLNDRSCETASQKGGVSPARIAHEMLRTGNQIRLSGCRRRNVPVHLASRKLRCTKPNTLRCGAGRDAHD